MPPIQRGHVRRLPSGKYQLRYYDASGSRRAGGVFASRSAAFEHYRNAVEPRLRGDEPAMPELTLRRSSTCTSTSPATRQVEDDCHAPGAARLRDARVRRHSLRELERMAGELADWQAALPERSRYGIAQALRQALEAAVRWSYMNRNPAKLASANPQPPLGRCGRSLSRRLTR